MTMASLVTYAFAHQHCNRSPIIHCLKRVNLPTKEQHLNLINACGRRYKTAVKPFTFEIQSFHHQFYAMDLYHTTIHHYKTVYLVCNLSTLSRENYHLPTFLIFRPPSASNALFAHHLLFPTTYAGQAPQSSSTFSYDCFPYLSSTL